MNVPYIITGKRVYNYDMRLVDAKGDMKRENEIGGDRIFLFSWNRCTALFRLEVVPALVETHCANEISFVGA